MHRLSNFFLVLGVFALAGFAACSDEENPLGGDDTGTIDGIVTKHTDPAALIAAHAAAISDRNLAAYEALLVQPGDDALAFEFYPKARDVTDFPWMEGDFWDYDTEIDMMTNMFDPNFTSPRMDPVQTVEMDLTVLSITQPKDGTYRVDCTARLLVMVGPNEGFLSDTRFFFGLVPVGDYLRIQRIEEVERMKAASGGQQRAETLSWARIKALYRTPPPAGP
jgi:hypothetical protein